MANHRPSASSVGSPSAHMLPWSARHHGIIPQTPGGVPIPDGILVIEAMMVTAVLLCIGIWNLARLRYEPVPFLSPAYVLAARIVRSLLVLLISAPALEWGLSSPFRFRGASFPYSALESCFSEYSGSIRSTVTGVTATRQQVSKKMTENYGCEP